jgi:hypothetical protein
VWLCDLKASLAEGSNNTYIGTDIAPTYFMQDGLGGVKLSVHSMKEPSPVEWQGTFDLIHQRMAFPAAGPKVMKQVISNMIGLLKPGGWIQFVESDHSIVEGPAMAAMFRVLCDVFKVLDVLLGVKNLKKELKAKSTWCFVLATKGMTQVAKSEGNPAHAM